MFSRSKSAFAATMLLVLLGCGGDNIQNAAHLRFFDAFTGTDDLRVYVGSHLVSGNGSGPAYTYGGDFGYARAPSGSNDIVADPYIDPTTTYATLAAQTLTADRNYTAIGMTISGARTIKLYSDSTTQASNTAYYRIIDASPSVSPIYLTLQDANGNVVYQSTTLSGGLTIGTTTGYRGVGTSSGDGLSYTLTAYDASDFSNSIGSATVTLQVGSPVTMVLYDKNSAGGGGVSIKAGVDVYGGV